MRLNFTCTILLLLFAQITFSQQEKPVSLLTVDKQFSERNQKTAAVGRSIFYKLDTERLNSQRNNLENIKLSVPIFNKSVNITLHKVDLLSSSFQVLTAKGEFVSSGDEYNFYQGFIEGNEENSIIGVTIRKGEFSLLMSDENGNFQIDRFDKDHLIGYYNNELKEQIPFECHTEDKAQNSDPSPTLRTSPSNECVDIYFEVDFAAYKKKSQNLTYTTDWVVNLFNQMALQFNRIGVPLKISEIMIHTEADPFVGINGMVNVLQEFRNVRRQTGFNGRLAHLLSTRSLGGGAAYLNTLCSNYSNFAVSGNLNGGVVSYPNYSWNVNVITHETGHNFGSNHTQACVWNGDYTAIDGCVGSEGDCPRPGLPENGGTIMSYCHLNGSVGINPVNGFGPQPGALINDNFQNANCVLSQDCSTVPPINEVCVTAIVLTPTQSCIEWSYHNNNQFQPSSLPAFSCGDANDLADVWFSVTVPSDGRLIIETSTINSGLSDMIMETYSGECNNLTWMTCDDNSGPGNHAQITIDDINLADEMIFLRVGDKGSNDEGEFSICAYEMAVPCTEDESKFLEFYTSMDGPNWTNKSGWEDGAAGTDCDVCQWYGITCNNLGQVIEIDLSDNNLTGFLTDKIDTFTTLKTLNLSNNNVSGNIPDDIGNLSLLKTLKLNDNNLSGQMPHTLRNALRLTYLDLSNNQLTGTTSEYLGYHNAIDYIDFSNNLLSGCFENSLKNICDISFISLLGNVDMAYNGDITQFCIDYSGGDSDRDGHCKNIDDCDDNNKDRFDGNPEICDGLDNDCNGIVDDGFENLVNEFQSVNAIWDNPANWSLGHSPLACEEIWIGMNDENYLLSVPLDTYGLKLKGLKVGLGSTFTIPETSEIKLSSSGMFENHGTIHVNGGIYSEKTDQSIAYGLRNFGEIHITNGYLFFSKQNGSVIINESSGTIINKGYISMYFYPEDPEVTNGIINYGNFTNHNSIQVQGILTGKHLVLKQNSTFTNYIGSQWDEFHIGN